MICSAGEENGCSTVGMGNLGNCHLAFDGKDWTGEERPRTARNDTCESLSKEYAANKFTLEGNENYLSTGVTCPQFWNMIVFRDPVTRLLSHLSMLQEEDMKDRIKSTTFGPNEVFKK